MFMQSLTHLHTYIPGTTLSLLILSLFPGFQTKKPPKADVGFDLIYMYQHLFYTFKIIQISHVMEMVFLTLSNL